MIKESYEVNPNTKIFFVDLQVAKYALNAYAAHFI